ncbi:MAG: MFS transporter [Acidimicrobiaceae bacterium]|nr:MFS transporter [Acidimicrobiaceae bacterium]
MPLLVDIGPLRRFPQFRRLWMGYVVTLLGSQLTIVAVAYQVYVITGSSLDVGFISLVQLGPQLVGSVVGGAFADAVDRRYVLIVCQLSMAVSSVGLLLNAFSSDPQLWVVYVCAAVTAGFNGADSPTRLAMQANLVPREDFATANTIRQLLQQVSYIAGPGIGGLLIASVGLKSVFATDVASFFVAIAAVVSMKALPPTGGGRRFGVKSIQEGFAYLKGRQVIQGCFVADLNATIFGQPTALYPALALHHFHGGAKTLGLLYIGTNIGSLAMAFLSGWTSRIRRQGVAVLVAITIWGAAIACFGLVSSLALAVVLLAFAGAADVISAVFRNTIIQAVVPDSLRGRLSAINIAVINGGPRLGNVEAGFAAGISTEFSVVSGGLICMLGALVQARAMPKFRDFTFDSLSSDAEEAEMAIEPATDPPEEQSGRPPEGRPRSIGNRKSIS